jgi:hypothetical protein
VGADGPDHPIAAYAIAGSVVSLWQLPAGQARMPAENDRNSYVVLVMTEDLEPIRQALVERGSRSARSAEARATKSCGSTLSMATDSS